MINLSFDSLSPLRREFLIRLNHVKRDLPALDLTYDDLRKLDLQPWFSKHAEAGVREFIRNLFLSGNGALLFGNSFVQWGASEAFRRAAPQAMFCRFGIRPKLKPFSGVVLFEDQNLANPIVDQPDPEGSFVDTQLLMEYIYLSALRGVEYAGRTLVLTAVPEQKRVLVLGPVTATTLLRPVRRSLRPGLSMPLSPGSPGAGRRDPTWRRDLLCSLSGEGSSGFPSKNSDLRMSWLHRRQQAILLECLGAGGAD